MATALPVQLHRPDNQKKKKIIWERGEIVKCRLSGNDFLGGQVVWGCLEAMCCSACLVSTNGVFSVLMKIRCCTQ